jgi:hypothetical protein
MAGMNNATKSSIFYFETEGRINNLEDVLKVLRKILKSREDLRELKIVVFTAEGRGPALAYNQLGEFSPRMIAVTFPRGFTIKGPNGPYCPQIAENVLKFFKGVEIDVITPPRLPFDFIEGLDAHNQQMRLVSQTISIFGSGFALCLQAVMCACDMGFVKEGETVIAFSGDTAGLFVASPTKRFLNPQFGLAVQEIFCKPRNLTISRPKPRLIDPETKTIEGEVSKA